MTGQLFNQSRYKQRRQDLRTNTTSPEQVLWQKLRGKQMGVKFRRQHGIGHYIVDFYCSERKLVIEVDGDSHFTDDAQEYDQIRDAYLQGLELTVLRFTNEQVMQNLVGVREIIRQVIEGKTPLPTSQLSGNNPLPTSQLSGNNPLPTSPLAGGGVRSAALVPSPAKGRGRVGFFVSDNVHPTCGENNPLPTSPLAGGGVRSAALGPSPAKGRVRVGFFSS